MRVSEGPYAERTGVVTAVGPDGRITVFIDECCQPMLAASAVSRVRGRDVGQAAREAKLADSRGETARMEFDSRDLSDGF